MEREPAARWSIFDREILNDCFTQQQPFGACIHCHADNTFSALIIVRLFDIRRFGLKEEYLILIL